MSTNPTLPIQGFTVTEQDLKEPGLGRLNQFIAQLQNQVNASTGAAGPVRLPSGIDVAGSTVTGLGPPQSPTDAVSSAHVDQNYSAAALQSQFDIGGPQALKGLTYLYQQRNANAITRATAASGSSVVLPGGTIMQFGLSGASATAVPRAQVTVTFPIPFTASVNVVCSPDNTPDGATNFPFICYPSAITLTGFTANFSCAVMIGGTGASNITNVVHCNWQAIGW